MTTIAPPRKLSKAPHASAPSNVPSRVHTPKAVPVVPEAVPFGAADSSDSASAINAALVSEAQLRAKYEATFKQVCDQMYGAGSGEAENLLM